MRFGGRRPPASPDLDLIRALARLLAENDLTEIEYGVGDSRVRVALGSPAATAADAGPVAPTRNAAPGDGPSRHCQASRSGYGANGRDGLSGAPARSPALVRLGETVVAGQTAADHRGDEGHERDSGAHGGPDRSNPGRRLAAGRIWRDVDGDRIGCVCDVRKGADRQSRRDRAQDPSRLPRDGDQDGCRSLHGRCARDACAACRRERVHRAAGRARQLYERVGDPYRGGDHRRRRNPSGARLPRRKTPTSPPPSRSMDSPLSALRPNTFD